MESEIFEERYYSNTLRKEFHSSNKKFIHIHEIRVGSSTNICDHSEVQSTARRSKKNVNRPVQGYEYFKHITGTAVIGRLIPSCEKSSLQRGA